MPLVDRPHDTPDFGPTERGKAVQLKCLVLCPYTADPRIMAAMPRGRACPFAAGPRTTPSFLPTITRSRPILQGYTQCTRWQERDGGSWTARNGEGGVLARFCLAPPPFSVVSPFECLSSLRVRHAIPPVREPSVQGAFRWRLEPRGVEQGKSGGARPSNFTRDRRGANRVQRAGSSSPCTRQRRARVPRGGPEA
jgi:hypothetical protein